MVLDANLDEELRALTYFDMSMSFSMSHDYSEKNTVTEDYSMEWGRPANKEYVAEEEEAEWIASDTVDELDPAPPSEVVSHGDKPAKENTPPEETSGKTIEVPDEPEAVISEPSPAQTFPPETENVEDEQEKDNKVLPRGWTIAISSIAGAAAFAFVIVLVAGRLENRKDWKKRFPLASFVDTEKTDDADTDADTELEEEHQEDEPRRQEESHTVAESPPKKRARLEVITEVVDEDASVSLGPFGGVRFDV